MRWWPSTSTWTQPLAKAYRFVSACDVRPVPENEGRPSLVRLTFNGDIATNGSPRPKNADNGVTAAW
jgi:hypothetical protein